MIVVLGGTGNIGRPTVAELQSRGAEFKAVSRNPDAARETLGPGVEVVGGDLSQPESLATAFAGADRVFLHSGLSPTLAAEQINAIDAAKAAGVSHIVKISGNENGMRPDAPAPTLRMHYEAEEALKASGVPYTLIRPNYFMQNLLAMAPVIAEQGKMIAPISGEVQVSMIDCRDIAQVAAMALTEDGHEGKIYALHGEPVSYPQIAAALSDALGKDVPYIQPPKEAAIQAMKDRGMPEFVVDHMGRMIDGLNSGMMTGDPSTLHGLLGEQRSLSQFIADHRAAFGG